MTTIKSVEYNQHDIIRSILKIEGLDTFDVDFTFGNGGFYKEIPMPAYRFDIDADLENTTHNCSSCDTPLENEQVQSIMFDPPFLTYVRAARKGNGNMVMAGRFGGYWRYDELEEHYKGTITEAYRVLGKKGIFVIKCQDIIHNHKMHCTHANILNWSKGRFRLKDLYILPAKHRMGIPAQAGHAKKVQKHARIYHSYFMVLQKI